VCALCCTRLIIVCRPPMHQCEVAPANESVNGGSLHLENKGAGEDVSTASDMATAVASSSPGTLLLLTCSAWKVCFVFHSSLLCLIEFSLPVTEKNSSIFSLFQIQCANCSQQGHTGSKTLLQQNMPVFNWGCWLTDCL